MKDIKEIIKTLRESDIRLTLNNDDLVVEAASGEVSDEILTAIRSNKDKLVTYFKKNLGAGAATGIKPVAKQDNYVLSSSQRRLWILHQMTGGSAEYNIPGVYVFDGTLDTDAFVFTFKALVKRHESLRTVFRENEEKEVRQFILDADESGFGTVALHDLRNSHLDDTEIAALIQEDLRSSFDLSTGPLIRASLYHVDDNRWIFSYVLHHIISDAWSMGILMQELLALYNAYTEGRTSPLQPLKVQYKDYASWQQEQLKSEALQKDKEYWLKQMEGELPVLMLPEDKERPAIRRNTGGLVSSEIEKILVDGIKQLVQEQRATMFMGLLAAVNVLLYRYSGQHDIIVGTPVAGRTQAELEGQIGFYLNTLALRSRFNEQDDFKEVLQAVRKTTLEAYAHQAYPFDELMDILPLKRELSRNALFDVMVDFHDNRTVKQLPQLGNIEVSGYQAGEHIVSKFDLTFSFKETNTGLILTIEYNDDLYTKSTIERLHTHFSNLLSSILTTAELPVNKLAYIDTDEITRLTETTPEGPAYRSVLSLFEEQVGNNPNKTALVYGSKSLTYKELSESIDKLAHYLTDQCEVKKNDFVGILLDRSEQVIIAILGVLKAGAAYVPVDTAYPKVRQEQILGDAGVRVLLTQTEYAFDLSYFEGRVFSIDVQLDTLDVPATPPVVNNAETDTAYVIFTSGSTGRPKGCTITHGNLSNYIQWCSQYYFDNATEGNFGLYTSLSFDLTVTSIFCPVTRGNTLFIYAQETEMSEILRHSFSAESGIDSIKLTPSHINYLQDIPLTSSTMHYAIVGGEEVLPRHVEILKRINPAIKIFNEYGPTEATVGCMVEVLELNTPITIGKPINGTGIYILDEQLGLCGIGIPGEICIGGAGVCQGYLGQPEMTADKFVQNPFVQGDRLYRTGDTGRKLNDGRIVYTGRKDDQVKVRGFRVELGEVEAALLSFPGVDTGAVIARPNAEGIKELVAYATGKDSLTTDDLRLHMNKALPGYMVPVYYLILDKLPLSAHGKIDRKALPDPVAEGIQTGTLYVAPSNVIEEKLVAIWSEVLAVEKERISVKHEFFDLGGHSLKITRLASLIYKEFEVEIELRLLFTTTTLEDQARLIAESKKMAFTEIMPVEEQPAYELSASQRRLWILSKFDGGNTAYNIPGAYVFEGDLDRDALTHSFEALIRRHEILRTIFMEDETGVARQFILLPEEAAFSIAYTDLRNEQQQETRLKFLIQEAFSRPFNLSTGPLLHAALYQLSEDKWVFSYVTHHIISDDLSTGIMIRELLTIYNAFLQGNPDPLPPLRIQYKDYAAWQQEQLKTESLSIHKDYWKLCFEGELPVLALPGDHARPPIKTYTGGIVKKWLDPALSKGLNTLIHQQDATLFMGLLATVNVLLYRYTGQEDIVVGSSIASRQHADLENQIGFYVNTLALRSRFKGEDNYEHLLENVKQVTIGAYQHQLYPFDELVEELNLQRDMSRHPLFEVMVVMQRHENGIAKAGQGLGDLRVNMYEGSKYVTSKFDLTFFFTESNTGDLHLSIIYNNTIYSENTAVRMLDHFEQLLAAIIQSPSTPVYQLDLIPAAERVQLLSGFNTSVVDYPKEKTVVDLFREQVARTPDNTALVFNTTRLSYRQLEEQSDRVAAYLLSNYSITADTRVGIMLDRSDKMIVGLLGILKAGAAYVPVDPDYPKARKEFMLKDSEIKILLTESHYIFELDYYNGDVFAIDIQLDESITSFTVPEVTPRPGDLAYVIYTSGSTGQPKGVMINHQSLVDYVYGLTDRTNVKECGTFGLMSTLAADLGNTVIYSSLLLGGSLHIFSASDVMDPEKLAAAELDCIKIVPSHWKALQEENRLFAPAKSLIFGGEQLSRDVLDYLRRNGAECEVYNHYGPTETTVGKLLNHLSLQSPDSRVSLGTPFCNTRIYIVDAYGELAPAGVMGEICIGGDGLARGYLNRPDLTDEKFIEAGFRKGERIYKTGDLGRWLADGTIAFAGRKDGQVKIRGYRIETGEIESALLGHPSVTDVAVIVKQDKDGNNELIAYVSGQTALVTGDLQSYLANVLPSYMVPGHFIQLEQLPLTANGKIDRRSLPDPEGLGLDTGTSYVAPRDDKEAALVAVYEEVLKKQPVGIKDSFFVLGGDSIKSIQIIARLKKRGYVLAIQDILLNPVIEQLVAHIKPVIRSVEQDTVTGLLPLSPIQQNFFRKSTDNSAHYNQSVLLVSKNRLNADGVKAVFGKIMLHHDALRMVFRETAEGWIQENRGEELGCSVEIIELADEKDYALHCDRIHASFDLANGPLFKIALFRGPEEDRLLMVAHHLIIDGVSWRIIFEDLSDLYHQYLAGEELNLPEKTDSFKYWMEKQSEYAHSSILQEEANYWNAIETLGIQALVPDYPEGSNLRGDAIVRSVVLNEEETERLLTQCYKAYKTDINDILIAALSLSLHDSFDMEHVVIRLEGHGREVIAADVDINRTIGWFTTHYPVVLDVKDGDNRLRQLLETKEYLHRIPNKGIGYGILKYLAGNDYHISPEISFNYLGDFGTGIASEQGTPLFNFSGDYKGKEMPDDRTRDILLNVNCMIVEGKMRLSIEYSKHQYNLSTIDGMLESFRLHLEGLIEALSTEKKVHLSPVDFTYKGLNLEQLEELDKL